MFLFTLTISAVLEKALSNEPLGEMEPPTKRYAIRSYNDCSRQCFDDVLDLSRKSNHVANGSEKLSSRVSYYFALTSAE